MAAVHIDFFTDFICPWCFIGKERITKVINNLRGEIDITLSPKPYILYPNIPVGGIDKSVFAKKTKPGMGRSLRDEAFIENLELNYKEIKRIPNSRKAHQLIANIPSDQIKWDISLKIIRDYFTSGQNIEDDSYLNRIIRSLYIEPVKETIDIQEELGFAREHHITLVPTIRLNKKVIIPGLQSAEVWTKYLKRASIMKL